MIDTADHVKHEPSGEEWLVARATETHVHPCGWPPSRGELKDCTLIKKATQAERIALLRLLAAGQSENAAWARVALGVGAPADPLTSLVRKSEELDLYGDDFDPHKAALRRIASMDPEGKRADDLGRAARIARDALGVKGGSDA